jgi:tRNA pseudouridine32 synthase/23S rRNA pseudouridine746 synthase
LDHLRGITPLLPAIAGAVDRFATRLAALKARGIDTGALPFEASLGRTTMEYYDGFTFAFVGPADLPPVFGAAAIAESELRVLYEDEYLVVVDKPSGLLSVPGRSGLLRDSVSTRLRARYPDATGQLVVHRLALDTSGLLLAAKDPVTFSALQRLFSLREISKRYVAWLDGEVAGSEGMIDFPIRMDVDDRPRQIHDPVHGKAAVTGWRVLDRATGRTKVALTPHTGRTHQLRVHASNPIGLDAPIVGDRLYGRSAPEYGERLLLHAESLAFTHPVTGALLTVTSPAPF